VTSLLTPLNLDPHLPLEPCCKISQRLLRTQIQSAGYQANGLDYDPTEEEDKAELETHGACRQWK